MLHEFLLKERKTILALCAQKLAGPGELRSSAEELELGLPIFFDELIEVLRLDEDKLRSPETDDNGDESIHRVSAVRCGRESLRLGYTISQVVHGYGALCQVITRHAAENADHPIKAREFNRLNYCLDVAIAEAVTEFSRGQSAATAQLEIQRLGLLAHELRNALSSAAAAHPLIKAGVVGFAGSTSQVLENSLMRMKEIIDRSLTEVRLRGQPPLEPRRCRIVDLLSKVEATSAFEAMERSIVLAIHASPDLVIEADPHLVVSALSNLIQNAIKFTKVGGNVCIRGKNREGRIIIEIEDECGGLPAGKIEELFDPFTQKGLDRAGVGLGLPISRKAVLLNGGTVTARDLPGKGCIFTVDLPEAIPLSKELEQMPESIPVH